MTQNYNKPMSCTFKLIGRHIYSTILFSITISITCVGSRCVAEYSSAWKACAQFCKPEAVGFHSHCGQVQFVPCPLIVDFNIFIILSVTVCVIPSTLDLTLVL